MPPKNMNYVDYMLPFKLLYRDVDSSEVSNLDKEFIKNRLRNKNRLFHHTRTLVKFLRRIYPKWNLMHRTSVLKTRVL